MACTIAFPVAAVVIEGLVFVLSERRKADPATPARDAYLGQLVGDAVAAEIQQLKSGTALKRS